MKIRNNKKKIKKNKKMIIIHYSNAILLKNLNLFPFADYTKILLYMLRIIQMSM